MKILLTDTSNGYEITLLQASNGKYLIVVENDDGSFAIRLVTSCAGTVDTKFYHLVQCGR